MEPKEIVKKTFFIILLLNFTFSGQETEEDWAEALDKLLYMKSEFTKQGDPGAVDIMLDNFKERKEGWMKVSAGWRYVVEQEVTSKKIADWYFSTWPKW